MRPPMKSEDIDMCRKGICHAVSRASSHRQLFIGSGCGKSNIHLHVVADLFHCMTLEATVFSSLLEHYSTVRMDHLTWMCQVSYINRKGCTLPIDIHMLPSLFCLVRIHWKATTGISLCTCTKTRFVIAACRDLWSTCLCPPTPHTHTVFKVLFLKQLCVLFLLVAVCPWISLVFCELYYNFCSYIACSFQLLLLLLLLL